MLDEMPVFKKVSVPEKQMQEFLAAAERHENREKDAKVKKDDPEQSERFMNTAKEIEADKTGKSFDRAMDALSPKKSR